MPQNQPTLTRFRHPVLDLPLDEVMRPQIALPLQHLLRVYTVGNLLLAWRSPKNQRSIERLFDSPDQARQAVGVCAAWLGRPFVTVASEDVGEWWTHDERIATGA